MDNTLDALNLKLVKTSGAAPLGATPPDVNGDFYHLMTTDGQVFGDTFNTPEEALAYARAASTNTCSATATQANAASANAASTNTCSATATQANAPTANSPS